MLNQTFIIFDTETTGFYPKSGDRITEIAAIKVHNGAPVPGATFESLVNPERPIPMECIQISGITDEMVATAPLIGDVMPKFLDFIGDGILVAHNAKFDMSFLEEELFMTNPFARIDNRVVCTKELSKSVSPQEKFHSLDTLVYRYGLPKVEDGRHRAMVDVMILTEVFLRLIKEGNIQTVDELLAKSTF